MMNTDAVDFFVRGGKKLSGTIVTNVSKNGSVSLLCAALINRGKTTLHGIAQIEEVNRLFEVFEAVGVSVEREDNGVVHITSPEQFAIEGLLSPSVSRIRSALMLIPPTDNVSVTQY